MAHFDCSYYSDCLKKNAHFIAFVPSVSPDDLLEDRTEKWKDIDQKFPTLYLLHGSYGGASDWDLRTSIERYAQDRGVAVIMPSGENSDYVTMKAGEDYLTYVGRELVEFTRKIFPLSRERKKTFIAGLSMGGYGSFRVGLEYPETFGKIASLSGALDMVLPNTGTKEAHFQKMPKNYMRAIFGNDNVSFKGTRDDLLTLIETLHEEKADLPELYMSVGNEDFIKPANDSFYQKTVGLGISVKYEHFEGTHSWEYWDSHILEAMNWLFS